MALSPAFSIGNNNSVTSTFLVTDLSTGSDVNIANRLLYIYDVSNTLLPNTPIQFPLSAGSTISPSILTQDGAFSFTLNWVDVNGVVLYTTSIIFAFTGFLEWFFYGLTQQIAAQSNIMNDQTFYANYSKLRVLIDSVSQAINIGNSLFNAQNMILLAQQLQQNSTLYF